MNYSALAIYFKIKAECFNCSVNYNFIILLSFCGIFTLSISLYSSGFFFLCFPYQCFQALGNGYIVFCELEMWLWFIPITFFPTLLYLYGAVTEDMGELWIHKSKEMLYFGFCLFASNSQLCICCVDATGYGEEKPHNQCVVAPMPGCNTVIQNKCFPSLWWLYLAYLSLCKLLWTQTWQRQDVLSFMTAGCSCPVGKGTEDRPGLWAPVNYQTTSVTCC